MEVAMAIGLALTAFSASLAPECSCSTYGEDEKPSPVLPASASEEEDKPGKRTRLRDLIIDKEDGKLDFSEAMAMGGFTPVPVIITEPAVDGGFGLVAQFVTVPDDDPRRMTRRMLGAVKTGNGSYGYGAFQSGYLFDGKVNYKLGVGRGKITLDAYPSFLPTRLRYTNRYDYGILGSFRVRLGDGPWSLGPLLDLRQLRSSLEFDDIPIELERDFGTKLNTGAVGLGLHYDTRDNALTPREGVNAYAVGKFNTAFMGSDRSFEEYRLHAYGFRRLSPDWHLGVKVEADASRGDYPSFFAPAINLRGVQASRYQGASVVSSELEVTHRLSDRWSVLAFGGVGATDPGGRAIFAASGAIFAGGAGFRYLIARKLGLDAGLDVAAGPGGAVFYLQFGHAWSMGLD